VAEKLEIIFFCHFLASINLASAGLRLAMSFEEKCHRNGQNQQEGNTTSSEHKCGNLTKIL
jgi:hypothetical protein